MKHKNLCSPILVVSLLLNPFSPLSQWLSGWKLARCLSLPILLLIVFCQLPIVAFAQNTFRYNICSDTSAFYPIWDIGSSEGIDGLYIGGSINPIGTTHQVLADTGYILFSEAGREIYDPLDNLPQDSALVYGPVAIKLNKYGSLVWIKVYKEVALYAENMGDGIPTSDGGFIIAGSRDRKFPREGAVSYLQKMDKDGKLLWSKKYDVAGGVDAATKILQLPDSGFIVMGTMPAPASTLVRNLFYLMRLDKNGNKLWCYVYDAKNNVDVMDATTSLDLTKDGGFMIGGNSHFGSGQKTKFLGSKGLMIKVSGNGAVEWARRYGGTTYISSYADAFYTTKQTGDGGYISVGATYGGIDSNDINKVGNPYQSWVVKTNSLGVIEWQKTYDRLSLGSDIEILNDGYVFAGGVSFNGMTKLSTTGEVLWSKIYDRNMGSINITMDSGFVSSFSGHTITKTNKLGEFDAGCFYNDAFSYRVDERSDTLYEILAKSTNVTQSDLSTLKEATITGGRHTCAITCDMSNKPIPPYDIIAGERNYAANSYPYNYIGTACVNTDAAINVMPSIFGTYNNATIFSYYKVDFGDPASGVNNSVEGTYSTEGAYSAFYPNKTVYHNYSNPGTYTITGVYYNGDYSNSDTLYTQIRIVPELKVTITTPDIRVCKKDTVTLTALFENYIPDVVAYSIRGWFRENDSSPWGLSGLGQQTASINAADSTLTLTATTVADTSHDYYYLNTWTDWYETTKACFVSDTVYVKTGDNEAFITGNTEICKGGTASLTAHGGDSYVWSTGATTATVKVSPTSNKTYWVEARSDGGCRDTGFVYVQLIPAINVAVSANKKAVCIGDTVTLYASGAEKYTWSNGLTGDSVTVIPTSGQNTYIVTGTSGLCTDTAAIQVSANPVPNGTISGPASYCVNDTVILTASGGDNYHWPFSENKNNSNPVQVFTGKYNFSPASVTITKGGCSMTAEYSVDPSIYPSPGHIMADECRVCPGTEVTLKHQFYVGSVDGITDIFGNIQRDPSLTYQWSTGQTGPSNSLKITVTKDTIITLKVANAQGCSSHSLRTIVLQVTPHFSITKEVAPLPTCDRSPTTIYLMGEPLFDTEYDWGNGIKEDTLVVSPLQDSMLHVTVTANGCTRTDSVFVYAKSNLPKATITGNAVVCKGVSSTYTASGNAAVTSYRWLSDNSTNPTIILNTNKDTTLKALLTFTGGCKDTAEYKIRVKDGTPALITGNTQLCPNGTAVLTASGGYYYQWSTGHTTGKIKFTTPKDSLISVIVGSAGCSDTVAVTITTDKILTATLFSDEDTLCAGTPLTLIAGGGTTYTWSTGEKGKQIGIIPNANTGYTVNASTGDDNCNDTASIFITVKPSPTLSVSGQTTLCSGRSATLQATSDNGIGYLWNTGASTASISVNPARDSTYSVSTFIGDCEVSQSLVINVIATTSISAGSDQTVLQGTEIILTPSGGTDYNWATVDGVICSNCNTIYESPTQTTTYYLSETGVICSEDSVTIYVLNCSNLFVPNAFSPNNDGANDVLYLKNDCIKDLKFEIYDRWGNLVFQSINVNFGWDGTYQGQLMNPTVFVYYINATLLSGEPISKKGNVSLIK